MRSIYRNLFRCMVAAVALLATSCTDDLTLGSNGSGDEVVVSFSVSPQGVIGATRSADDPTKEDGLTHISDGKKANMLIYAVYDEDNNLLPQYGEGIEEKLKQELKNAGFTAPTLGEGQTAIYAPTLYEGIENRILIRLLRGKKYRVAFWAQSLGCKAYNTKDLKKVEVIYGADKDSEGNEIATPNNDEMRDVFCQVAKVNTGDVSDLKKDVTLYRPLAQINVGTSGYDFETVTRGNNSKKYRYSRIQLSSAARYLSVPENKVLTSTTETDNKGLTTEVRQTVNYDFAPLPAYYNYKADGGKLVPDDPSNVVTNEEYLRVDLGGGEDGAKDGVISPYVGLDDYKKNENIKDLNARKAANYTETFKYLSMCYILVPVQESDADKTDVPPTEQAGGGQYTTTLDNVRVWLATDEKGTDEKEIVAANLTNVPVHRNWRTNIISQELLTTGVDLMIDLEPMYAGDYNTDNFGESWSGQLSADKSVGAYYDAINDEILISNVEGLLWLERMVNGKYEYKVYDEKGEETTFSHSGIEDPTTSNSSEYAGMTDLAKKALKARIMRATHQDQNPNNNYQWPTNNNFHFMGAAEKDPLRNNQELTAGNRLPALVYPAKVRLMADLDLSSYEREWIPIGFANNTAEAYNVLDEKAMPEARVFCGQFDGGNHTIYNLSNKRFPASVFDATDYQQTSNKGPYDKAVQWFAVGLFGQIGQNGSVSNLRMKNVDLFGYCHVGGIAGILTGQDAFIYNCYVDGGTITAAPMYRGDSHRATDFTKNGRTFARGIFASGIVGYLNVGRTTGTSGRAWDPTDSQYLGDKTNLDPNLDKYASVQNCDVRNLTIRAYRQIGGIVGALNNYDKSTGEGEARENSGTSRRVRNISGNNVTNVTIIADKFQPYDVFFINSLTVGSETIQRNAFGWQVNQLAWSDMYVGGNPENNVDTNNFILYNNSISGNSSSDVVITDFATGVMQEKDDQGNITYSSPDRNATIEMIPLNLMPMLSSFFTDKVTLKSNFTGKHSAYKYYKQHQFYSDSRKKEETIVNVPCNLPNDLSIDWITTGNFGNVGMYIESIELNGASDGRDRTIVTIEDAKGSNDCVAYIGGRNHADAEKPNFSKWNNHETKISSMVFRGQPYAYTGICLAPTSSTTAINLDNVSVYDVYQTLALDSKPTNNANKMKRRAADTSDGSSSANNIDNKNTALSVSNSNLRGYTNYGSGWKSVNFTNTVFERGANITSKDITNTDNIQTCEVKQNTTFTNCYFKAPYTIKIAEGVTVTFDNSVATATSNKNIQLKTQTGGTITITSDSNGNAVVTGNSN